MRRGSGGVFVSRVRESTITGSATYAFPADILILSRGATDGTWSSPGRKYTVNNTKICRRRQNYCRNNTIDTHTK